MNYFESVTYIFKDRRWLGKMALTILASSPIVIGWIALDGWYIEVFRRAANGADEKLPGWEHWRTYLRDGFACVGVQMIWLVPGTIIAEITGWPSWITSIPCDILFIGALIVLARTGSFGQAVNPVNAWEALKPHIWQWLLVGLLTSIVSTLWSEPLGDMFSMGLHLRLAKELVIPLLLAAVLDPWWLAITGNLFGRIYRESGATV